MKTIQNKSNFQRLLSFFLLFVFIFCTTSSITSAPLCFSKTKSFQKESRSSSDSESFVFEELDEDIDDDSVDAPVLDLFHSIGVFVYTSQFLQTESVHSFSEVLIPHTPLFISNRILRI
ncbi:MAG: hypothetical protein ACJ76F_09630 [Bacteroidia bacterium]